MKKIAILGCENSHADAFLTNLRDRKEFSGVQVVGVYSDDDAAARKLQEKFGVPVLSDFRDAVGKVDGILITGRYTRFRKLLDYIRQHTEWIAPIFIYENEVEQEAMCAGALRVLRGEEEPKVYTGKGMVEYKGGTENA